MANPSELEGVVLGIIHAQQPCTPYAIRRELSDSPSTYWSASAGSIYPLIKRLVGNGWLVATPDKTDRRGRQVLRLTRAGQAALRSWTTGGSDPEVATRMYDSLRVRMFSLGALRPRERRRFAKKALAALEDSLANTQRHLESRVAEASEFEHLANLGGVCEAEARVRWMREVVATIG